MKTWPSLALRLLARMLRQGAHFLERQEQKIEHWAEQVTDPGAETSTGEDASSASSGEPSPPGRSPGDPPAHWLEKIESSEGPVQWIEHAGEGSAEDRPRASPRSLRAAFPAPFRSRDKEREDLRFPAPAERDVRTEGEEQHMPAASDETPGRAAPSPRFEKSTEEAARTEAHRERKRGTGEAGREQASGLSPSTSASKAGPDSGSDPEGASARDALQSSQPARLQPSPSRNRPGRGREAAREHTSPGEQTASDAAQKGERAVSFPFAEAGTGESGVSEAEPPSPPSLPDAREEPSDSARRLASEHPTGRAFSHSEHVAFGRQHPASSPASSESSRVERSESSSDVSAASEVAYRSNKPPPPERKEDIPPARPSRFHWPDLPEIDQIVEEDLSASRRWARRMRDWERRRRLNREQRGQLWSA